MEPLIKEDILNAVQKYEPRVTINSNDIFIEQNGRTVNIYLQYTIKETGEVNDYNLELTTDDNPYNIL